MEQSEEDYFIVEESMKKQQLENRLIEPWVEEELLRMEEGSEEDVFYVPDYIVQYAEEVLTHYPFSVKSMTVVTTKSDKGGAIWRLETSDGPKSLKLLHRRPTRSLFSLGAQEYLVNVQKANVPPIVKTKDGANYLVAGGKCWFVAEWIEPLMPVTKDLEGAKHLCYALGEFHRLSKGYVPPEGAERPTRLFKWEKSFKKVVEKMDWFRNIANAYKEMPASSLLLSVVDQFEEQARKGLAELQQSRYYDLTKLGNEFWGLVHQDYGWSNGQMGADGMWIIDLDGVAYDIPIRDLRKLITGTMSDLFTWDITWIREMIQAYHKANPISREVYDLLMIDLAMPNEFYKNIKEVVYEPELFLNEETAALINTIVETDKTKWPALEELWKDREKFEPMNIEQLMKDLNIQDDVVVKSAVQMKQTALNAPQMETAQTTESKESKKKKDDGKKDKKDKKNNDKDKGKKSKDKKDNKSGKGKDKKKEKEGKKKK